jgi:PHD/YefM family antitoxin component YafN of YafNO toxin-antitoxin module
MTVPMTDERLDSIIDRIAARNRTDGITRRRAVLIDLDDYDALIVELRRLREQTPRRVRK